MESLNEPPQAVTVRQQMPTPGSQVTTAEHIQGGDWVRLPGHVDWRKSVGGVITLGPMTRVLWAQWDHIEKRWVPTNSDMLTTSLTVEVIRPRNKPDDWHPDGMRAS